jgi:polyhydroxyalkanoate synthesis regulator phasin
MATKKQEPETEGTLGRLSKAGEDALTRLFDELGKNERVTGALDKATSAKGKLDESARRALGQVGVAAADELKDLRSNIERLEKRLAKLEAEAKPKSTTKPKTKTRAKKTTEKTSSPAPGRSIGGGTGRGSGSGGTAA